MLLHSDNIQDRVRQKGNQDGEMKQMNAAAGQLQDKQREGHGLTSLSDGEGTGRWPTGGAGRRARPGPEGTAAVAASGFRGGGGVGLPQRLGRPAGSRVWRA